MHISLLVPGLLDGDGVRPEAREAPDMGSLVGLEWLLTLANRQPLSPDRPATLLTAAPESLPAAALSYLHDFGQPPPGPVLRADPVNLEADRDCVRLLAADMPDLDMDSARQMIAEINSLFVDEPWQLLAGTAQRWYLLLEDETGIHTRSPAQVLGDDIHDAMPTGDDARYWRKIINEIQMLMFASPVNRQRLEQGRLAANSLWLWGEGTLPAAGNLPWTTIYSNDPVIAGLGRQAGCEVAAVPEDAEAILARVAAGSVLCQPELGTGVAGLGTFNDTWAWPLYKALQQVRRGGKASLQSVELLPANGYAYVVQAGKRPWWRRRRRLDHFRR
jgi:hypothetical protein